MQFEVDFSTKNLDVAEDSLRSAGFGDILNSPFLQRLAGVSFLSTLDLVYQIPRPTNRYEHSLGVGLVALKLANRLSLDSHEKECLVIANLLHDIGHAPFSHNAEPFLLEQLRLYHKGLGSTYLRYNSNLFPGKFSASSLLDSRDLKVRKRVTSILSEKFNGGKDVIAELHRFPINCDKIDGNNRTLRLLGLKTTPEETLISAFSQKDQKNYIKWASVPCLIQFWNAERDLYWKHIYTMEVFAAEAMITKALEQIFVSAESLATFVISTDTAVRDLMRENELSLELFDRIEKREFLRPLSETYPDLYNAYKPRFIQCRFAKDERRQLEMELSNLMGTDPTFTISHFSRRKHFVDNFETLYQRSLFDEIDGLIPLERVGRAFVASKQSGDFFEIFYGL